LIGFPALAAAGGEPSSANINLANTVYGYLAGISNLMYHDLGATSANVLMGAIGAVLGNIPILFAVLAMDPDFTCTISDDRGDEPVYAGYTISEILEKGGGIGDVISLLWFKRPLPAFATKFFELVLVVSADHGPAVSGAHNATVTARAGKDMVSALASGLLTIGPRFGGAINDAAVYFKEAKDRGLSAKEFVSEMKDKGINIPGIGHRVKSLQNPDKRVEILSDYAKKNFPSTAYLDFAREVEALTTEKRNNLILNVDGCIAVVFLDLLASTGIFSESESREIVKLGYLNGFFVVARAIGMIGHIMDQYRLKKGLYRHPWDDILYDVKKWEE